MPDETHRTTPPVPDLAARRAELLALPENWDSYKARTPSATAIDAACSFSLVPLPDGDIQMEWHIGGVDIEIEFNVEGEVESVYWSRSRPWPKT